MSAEFITEQVSTVETAPNHHEFEQLGYRVIQEWPAYMMSTALDVWSLPRLVACKGGATRQTTAKKLKTSTDGRVSLRHNGETGRFHVYRELFPTVFPELCERPQCRCRKGHPISQPLNPEMFGRLSPLDIRVTRWGTGNRICTWCHDVPEVFDVGTYSLQYGVGPAVDHTGLPAEPKLLGRLDGDGDRDQLQALEWGEHGYLITKSPLSGWDY